MKGARSSRSGEGLLDGDASEVHAGRPVFAQQGGTTALTQLGASTFHSAWLTEAATWDWSWIEGCATLETSFGPTRRKMHFVSASCLRLNRAPVMRRRRIALLRDKARVAAVVALLCAGASVAQDDGATATLRATTLSGVDVTLPDADRAAILLVGFGRDAGAQVRQWRQRIDEIDSGPSVASVMVIDGVPRLLRGVLTRTMRGEVAEERQHTIYLVTEDGDAWRALAQFDETNAADEAYVLRFDGGGQVCFRHVGPIAESAASDLLAADCGMGSPAKGG